MKASSLFRGAMVFSILAWVGAAAWPEDLEPLQIELPNVIFTGTPVEHWSPNFEPENYKDRPPYLVPKGTALLSRGKPVTSSAPPILGDVKQITDGEKKQQKKWLVELDSGPQWVQIDLEKEQNIFAILVWHYLDDKRVYIDMVIRVSGDPEFKQGVTTVYNNDYDNSMGFGAGQDKEYVEKSEGRLIGIANGVKGRYVRLYGNGNSSNDKTNYVEVEVFGKE